VSNQNNFHRSDRDRGVYPVFLDFFPTRISAGTSATHLQHIDNISDFRCLIYAVTMPRHLHSVDYKMPISNAPPRFFLWTGWQTCRPSSWPHIQVLEKNAFWQAEIVAIAAVVAVCYGKFNQPRVQGRSNATNELPHTQPAGNRWGRNDATQAEPTMHLEKKLEIIF